MLVKGDTNACFRWHSDGKRIMIAMRDPMRKLQQLYLIDREDEKLLPKALRGQPLDTNNLDADWSPDEKWIVFTKRSKPQPK